MRELKLRNEKGILTAALTCELDHHTAKTVREEIDRALTNGKISLLVLDFSGVSFMDSSGIGLIIGRADRAATVGVKVKVTGLIPNLKRLVRLSGLTKLENLDISD